MVRIPPAFLAVALTLALAAPAPAAPTSSSCEPILDSLAVCLNYLAMNPHDGTVWGSNGDHDGRWITRLEDHGQSRTFVHHFSHVIIAIHFLNDGTMFVSTDGDYQSAAEPCSLFRSVDAGQTFVPVKVLPAGCAVNMSFAHDRLDNLYVGEYGPRGVGQSNRVWKTSNRGYTWQVIFQAPNVDDIHIHRVAVDPFTQDLWVTYGHSQFGAYRSQDRGQHWSLVYWNDPSAVAFTPSAIYWGEDHYLGMVSRTDRNTGVTQRVLQVSSLGPYGGSVYDMTVGRSGDIYVPFVKYPGQTQYPSIWKGHDSDWHLLQTFVEPQTGAAQITAPDLDGDMYVMYHRIRERCPDRVPPAAPACFQATVIGRITQFRWCANLEADFWTYRLYRGIRAGFTPDSSSLVVAKSDVGYSVGTMVQMYYKLTAVDRSGNESAAVMVWTGPPSDPLEITTTLALRVAVNPVTRMPLVVDVDLPTSAAATLELLDVAGRRLCLHQVGGSTGTRAVSLMPGATLRSGEYFLRLTQEHHQLTRRIAVVR